MFFKTFAEKKIEDKGRDYDRAVRKARHEKDEEIARLNQEIGRLRSVLEIIAGSSDRLQALQARAALDNIGAKV